MKGSHSFKSLFTSNTRLKLISLLFSNPSELYYVRQLVRLADEEINSVRRELGNLKSSSIVLSENRANRLYYWANPDHFLFYQLTVLANQNSGLGEQILDNRHKIGNIKLLLFNHLFLNHRENNGIDLIVVGDASLKVIDELVKVEEKKRDREINYMVMDKNEFKLRKVKRDPILVDFFLTCPAVIIGNPVELI
jgi:hypothetical protein